MGVGECGGPNQFTRRGGEMGEEGGGGGEATFS